MSTRGEFYAGEVRDLWIEDPKAAEYIEEVTGQRTADTIYAWALGEYQGASGFNGQDEPSADWLTWNIFVENYDALMEEDAG